MAKHTRRINSALHGRFFCMSIQVAICLAGVSQSWEPSIFSEEVSAKAEAVTVVKEECKDDEDKKCDHHRGSSEERSAI
ncbi:hypothetical protein [Phormidium sp. CCY1219]|uniref:hypothetical protein n=1 Tax=Phormidium sp. CCY1219 TaxID=2886104 RepID=UPI002D1EB1DC|nr:hypothetical protein [Phormidium sp. CCY1219]MEB3831676.1 hypothetical protein [Phormidium sp. CCY1219]